MEKLDALQGQKRVHCKIAALPCKKEMHCRDRRGCIAKIGGITGTEGDALQKRAALQGCDRVPCKKGMHCKNRWVANKGTHSKKWMHGKSRMHCKDRMGSIAKKGCIADIEGDALEKRAA